ncbi:MAG TPA: molecular chaperone DnaJ [Cryptosporangiaceae bacterium]|nr:molecular chaperone DnaJ [Cryptosporangiaceae bacterium]
MPYGTGDAHVAKDYYGSLGVSRDATPEQIKRAYRKLARELHPDVNPDPVAQDRFKAVSSAYEVLSDPAKREIVDLGGDPLASGNMGGGTPGQPFTMGFQDIMDAFFGGGGSRGPRPRTRPGADALIRLDLDLAEMAFGINQELTVDTAVRCTTCSGAGTAPGTHPASCDVCGGRGEVQTVQRSFLGQVMTSRPCAACQGLGTVIPHPCPACAGDGRVRTRRTLTVKVPAGVEDGMRIRLAGEGEVGPGGGPSGDLYVEVHERPHDVFTRQGDDLHCRVVLPMTAAALGTSLTLKTLDGDEQIDIKPGTQGGTVIRVRGRGVPHLRGTGRGDMHVHLEVRTPTRLDPEQERLMRELAKARGEEHPESLRQQGGFFSKVRDAFNGYA